MNFLNPLRCVTLRFVTLRCVIQAACVCALTSAAARADDPPAPRAGRSAATADEQAIVASAEAYDRAMAAKDPKAVAALFTPDGEVVETDGSVVRGREAIAAAFGEIFAAFPRSTSKVTIQSVRVVAPGTAIEDGKSRVVLAPGQPPVVSRYCVTHVKQGSQWLIASARDLESNSSTVPIGERLKPLEWLIGDWVDEDQRSVVTSSYRWTDEKKYLLQHFDVKRKGETVLKGSQRIGWDPSTRTIKSWVFDSDGGHGEGVWTWDGARWIVNLSGVSSTGTGSSSTAYLVPINKNSYRWISTGRVLGGAAAPSVSITVVRRPPAEHTKSNAGAGVDTPSRRGNGD